MPTLKLSQQKALAGEAVTCGLTVESLVSVKQAQETEWQLHGYAVPVPLFLGSLGLLLIPAIAVNWWGPGSAHKGESCPGFVCSLVGSFSSADGGYLHVFAVLCEMTSKNAVPSVRHQGL